MMSMLVSAPPRAVLISVLRSIINGALLYCMEVTRGENDFVNPSAYIRCITELIEPVVKAAEEWPPFRDLLEKFGINLDVVLGGAPPQSMLVAKQVPATLPLPPPPLFAATGLPMTARVVETLQSGGKPSPEELKSALAELAERIRQGGGGGGGGG